MARTHNKLTARTVTSLTTPGRHSDGGGLYLHISGDGGEKGRRWIFRYTSPRTKKVREMGLGPAVSEGRKGVTLAQARGAAADARELVRLGSDPIDAKRDAERDALNASGTITFGAFADQYVANMSPSWRNEKHRAQWSMTLREYAAPIRSKPIDEVEIDDVLAVLTPIWHSKPETASRLRGRIETVLASAYVKHGIRKPNPATWRGNLATQLPKPQKPRRGHHAALPYRDVPEFMEALREREGIAASLLTFTVLCAARSGEAIYARWSEVDFAERVWSIPAERMKAGREHRVPLSDGAIAILEPLKELAFCEFVFPSERRTGRPLSTMAMTALLRRMGRTDITVHGFRSAFSDWCAEETSFPAEVREMALAHTIGNKAEAAYRRGQLLEKRRQLMEAWATHCGYGVEGSTVVSFDRVRAGGG